LRIDYLTREISTTNTHSTSNSSCGLQGPIVIDTRVKMMIVDAVGK